jgi:hypothetical protein
VLEDVHDGTITREGTREGTRDATREDRVTRP